MGGLRISVLSIKGGAGKSTIALTTALELTEMGRNVLLIDRDLLGYSSQLAGIRGKGLLASVVEGGNGGNYIVKKRRFTWSRSGNRKVSRFAKRQMLIHGVIKALRLGFNVILVNPKGTN